MPNRAALRQVGDNLALWLPQAGLSSRFGSGLDPLRGWDVDAALLGSRGWSMDRYPFASDDACRLDRDLIAPGSPTIRLPRTRWSACSRGHCERATAGSALSRSHGHQPGEGSERSRMYDRALSSIANRESGSKFLERSWYTSACWSLARSLSPTCRCPAPRREASSDANRQDLDFPTAFWLVFGALSSDAFPRAEPVAAITCAAKLDV